MTACCKEKTYEVTITGMESRPLIADGDQFVEFDSQTSISKEALIIEVLIQEEEVIVLNALDKKNPGNIPVLEAAVVPCEDQIVVFTNQLTGIKVEVLDTDNGNARIDVTNQLIIEGSQTAISDYIAENTTGIGGFYMVFANTSNLPNRITYEIEATLDNGGSITASGGVINFN